MLAPEQIVAAGLTLSTCFFSILWWDWLISLKTEIRYIWHGDWSTIKILYFISRYWMLFASIFKLWAFWGSFPYDYCERLVHWVAAVPAVAVIASTSILAFRTYVIWLKPRWLLYMIGVLLSAEIACMTAACTLVTSVYPPGIPRPCYPAAMGGKHSANFTYFMLPAVCDATFTALSTYKALKLRQPELHDSRITRLLNVFVRDGLMYFVVVTAIWLVEMAFYLQPIKALQSICAPTAVALSSIMSCRLVLSLKSFNDGEGTLPASCQDVPYRQHSLNRNSSSRNAGAVQIQIDSCSRLSEIREDIPITFEQALYSTEKDFSSMQQKTFSNLRLSTQ